MDFFLIIWIGGGGGLQKVDINIVDRVLSNLGRASKRCGFEMLLSSEISRVPKCMVEDTVSMEFTVRDLSALISTV